MKIILFVYSVFVLILSPLLILVFIWRYGLRKTLNGIYERIGGGGFSDKKGGIWIHAASVGEVRAVEPFLKELSKKFIDTPLYLTTTAMSGKVFAEKLSIAHEVRLAPLDLSFCIRRFICGWKPKAVVFMETELWPNWIQTLSRFNIPTCLINGRISDRSYRSYWLFRFFWGSLLKKIDKVGVQSPLNASRFNHIGANSNEVQITGNLKWDIPLPSLENRSLLFNKYGFNESDFIWVCGSTHEKEEILLLDTWSSLCQKGHSIKLVLAPRYPERTQELIEHLNKEGISFSLRTNLKGNNGISSQKIKTDVFFLDTIGELSEVYGLSSLVFIGGTFTKRGGQNPLEPARWGAPILFGPHMENFKEIVETFLEEKGAIQVCDQEGLEKEVLRLLKNEGQRSWMGNKAREIAQAQKGALSAHLNLVEEALRDKPQKDNMTCGVRCEC